MRCETAKARRLVGIYLGILELSSETFRKTLIRNRKDWKEILDSLHEAGVQLGSDIQLPSLEIPIVGELPKRDRLSSTDRAEVDVAA